MPDQPERTYTIVYDWGNTPRRFTIAAPVIAVTAPSLLDAHSMAETIGEDTYGDLLREHGGTSFSESTWTVCVFLGDVSGAVIDDEPTADDWTVTIEHPGCEEGAAPMLYVVSARTAEQAARLALDLCRAEEMEPDDAEERAEQYRVINTGPGIPVTDACGCHWNDRRNVTGIYMQLSDAEL